MNDWDSLCGLVARWANDRNIIRGSDAIAQLSKTLEECGELLAALNQYYCGRPALDDVIDAYGDILVTLLIGMEQVNVTPVECLSAAYDEIKDRKGKMVNGVFTKEDKP